MFRATLYRILCAAILLLFPLAGCKKTVRELLKSPKESTIDQEAFEAQLQNNAPRLNGPQTPAIFLSHSLDGYIEPCGCTEDVLYGGIDRLVGTLDALRHPTNIPSLYAHGGNTLFRANSQDDAPNDQDRARLELLQYALERAQIAVLGVGPSDLIHGLDIFEEFASKLPAQLISTNVQPADTSQKLGARAHVETLQDTSVAFLNLIHPSAFEGEGVAGELRVQELNEALTETLHQAEVHTADLRIVFAHGDPYELRDAFDAMDDLPAPIDFIVLSTEDASTDRVQTWGSAQVLSLWSHGRDVGALRWTLPSPDAQDAPTARTWKNARILSRVEQEEYREIIAHLSTQIDTLEAEHADAPPPMLKTLQERKQDHQETLAQAQDAQPPVFASERTEFLWDVFLLAPDMPEHSDVHHARRKYNQTLQAINARNAQPPPPPADGAPGYIGAQSCKGCHEAAYDMWQDTPHADAYHTLQARDKAYDLDCIACHVTGYAQPGGSTLGHTDGLEDVQCESCHGPGSLHARTPTQDGAAHAIAREVPEATCIGCHTTEHSTRFEDASYRAKILGPGHGEPAHSP